MVRAVGAADRFRVPILHALYDLADDGSANQLCELARHYAATGDETFRTRLYEIVAEKPVAYSPWVGEEDIIALDGEQGLLFAARIRGEQLASREWEWDDGRVITFATERLGEKPVHDLLGASSDAAIQRLWHRWKRDQQRAENQPAGAHRARMTAIPVAEIFQAAESTNKCVWFRGWGMHADDAALRLVLQRLWSVSEPTVMANLLKVFSNRALPEFDARLVELCRHNDEEVRRRAYGALEQNTHALAREFALAELQAGRFNGDVVSLFINNYQPGDEQRILDAMELPDDADELHWLVMEVVKVLENNPGAGCLPLGVIAYSATPCGGCRYDAARLLHDEQVAPEWMRSECLYDSCEDCRELPARTTNTTDSAG
jgi:hypothetical protein